LEDKGWIIEYWTKKWFHRIQDIFQRDSLKVKLLQTQDLRVDQADESCIGLIQENSMENSVQDCLSYIILAQGL